jgi:hypothetical protein
MRQQNLNCFHSFRRSATSGSGRFEILEGERSLKALLSWNPCEKCEWRDNTVSNDRTRDGWWTGKDLYGNGCGLGGFTMKHISQNSRCLGRDSNRVLPEAERYICVSVRILWCGSVTLARPKYRTTDCNLDSRKWRSKPVLIYVVTWGSEFASCNSWSGLLQKIKTYVSREF